MLKLARAGEGERMKEFSPFRLDTVNQCLRRCGETSNEERIPLTPKAFAVLRYLVEHRGRLVTQCELLEALWPDTYVQPEVLKNQILDIRRALGDHSKNPRFIETFPRRGYQFIAQVTESLSTASVALAVSQTGKLVGRDRSLRELRDCLNRTADGARRVLLLTGEPGIGKTALVDEFLCQTASVAPSIRFARGQCLEGYGGKEAYYPMLETLGQLCRGPGGDSVVQILAKQAPTWLAQFPDLLQREHLQTLQRELLGATRERMLREIGDAIEVMTACGPLLLVFEDLQWVDPSTVDLISALARSRRSARLMLLATYRPVDETFSGPWKTVKQDLLVHHLCQEIVLSSLSEADVAEYLACEAPVTSPPEGLAALVHRHSEGNPLFMVAALDHMAAQGLIACKNGSWQLLVPLEQIDPGVPESLRQMIEAQIETLSAAEQRLLEVASVNGAVFSSCVSAVAAGLSQDSFEEHCEELSRRRHLVHWVDSQQLPDGRICNWFKFVHALYREVCYRRQPAGLRAKFHRRIGLRLEEMFPERLSEMAPELAHHFEAGADWARAVKYLEMIAETARRRYVHREAAAILEHALELLHKLPGGEYSVGEIEILQRLAATYLLLFDPRTVETYETLVTRADHQGLIEVQVSALIDMALPLASISSQRYREVLERALRLSDGLPDPTLRARMRATCLVRRMAACGWSAEDAKECRDTLESVQEASNQDVPASNLIDWSFIQSLSSQYRDAHRSAAASLAILSASGEENPYLAVAYWLSHRSLLFLGEWGEALREIDFAIARVEKNGNRRHAHGLRLYRAWALLYASDYTGVLETCDSVFSFLHSIGSSSGLRLCQVLAGTAEVMLGHHERALQHLLTARDGMDREILIFDWYWRIPLESALTELWLARRDLAQARPQAERFLQAALATAEHTCQAMAWEAHARVAMAEGNFEQAQASIGNALSTLQGFEAPLAAWRVHATCAEFYEVHGKEDSAERHLRLSRATILRLANSLPANSPLREKFLSAPSVSRILSSACASADVAMPRG
jgi:DNA-binding winged helix-turn-helix (wHTH) protein/tetratricopeptide (TPR) repeat protein